MPRDTMVHAFVFSYHSDHTALATLIREHLVEPPLRDKRASPQLDRARCGHAQTEFHRRGCSDYFTGCLGAGF